MAGCPPTPLAFDQKHSPACASVEYIDLIQWPAMITTVIAAWLVASQHKRKREFGFWCFLFSNALWVIWGWHDRAYALIALQLALAALNIRGARKNDPASGPGKT